MNSIRNSHDIEREFQSRYSPLMDTRMAQAYRQAITQAKQYERHLVELVAQEQVRRILYG